MALLRILIRRLTSFNLCSNTCPLSVRRNASSIAPEPRALSSEASSIPVLDSSKQKAIRRIKPATAAAVSALVREYGFTDAHISRLKSRVPRVFELNPQKNMSLKLKFLESIGLSSIAIPKLVMGTQYLLLASLEKKMIPCYNYLKNLSVYEEQLSLSLKSQPHLLTLNLEATIAPNVELLRGMRVPFYVVTTYHYCVLCGNHALFKSSIDQAIKIGLSPSTKTFILAVRILCAISKETWERKMAVCRGFELSDDEIILAFIKQPNIMSISEKTIATRLEFFLKELSWSWARAALVSNPVLLQLNIERTVMPRCQFMEILRKKGFLKIPRSLHFLTMSEEKFVNAYIHKYKDDSSELMDIYKSYSSSSQNKTSQGLVHNQCLISEAY